MNEELGTLSMLSKTLPQKRYLKNVATERMLKTWPALHMRYESWISHALLKQRDLAEYLVLLFDQTRVFQ